MVSKLRGHVSRERILGILVVIILFFTLRHFLAISLVESDSLFYEMQARVCGAVCPFQTFLETSVQQGRITVFGGLWYSFVHLFDNFLYFKFVTLLLIVSNILLLGILATNIFGSQKYFWWILLFFSVTVQNSWHPNTLFFYPGMFTGSISIFLLSLILFERSLQRKGLGIFVLSLVLYFASLLSYEVFLLYIPAFFLILIQKVGIKNLFSQKKLLAIIEVGFVYILLYILFRSLATDPYVGASGLTFSIRGIAEVIFRFSIASLPLYMFIQDTWSVSMGVFQNGIINNKDLLTNFQVWWLVKALFVSGSVYLLVKWKNIKQITKIKLFVLGAVASYFFLIPPLPLALTAHYQYVAKFVFLSGPVTYFSYLAFIFFGVIFIEELLQNKKMKKMLTVTVVGALVAISIVHDYTNASYGRSQALAYDKWFQLEGFRRTDLYTELRVQPTCIVAPYMFESFGTLLVTDPLYWTKRLEPENGNIRFVKDLSDCEEKERLLKISRASDETMNSVDIILSQDQMGAQSSLLRITTCSGVFTTNQQLNNQKTVFSIPGRCRIIVDGE